MGPLRRRPTDCAPSLSPCDRAFDRHPALARRVGGGGNRGRGGRREQALVGVTNFSAGNRLESAGGEAGAVTGFGVVLLGRLDRVVAAYRVLCRRYNGANGYAIDMLANNGAFAFAALADDGTLKQAQRFFAQSDVGRIVLFTCLLQNGALQLYVGRELVASTPIVGYRVATATASGFGADVSGVTPAVDATLIAHLTLRGTPTAANVAAFADEVRLTGDLPESFPGATVTHRHSVRDELRDKPNNTGRKTHGARNFSAANHFVTNAGMVGAATGFAVAIEGRFDSIPSGANARMFGKSNSFSAGWRLCCINAAWQLNAFGNAGSADEKNSPAYTVTAADLGRKRRALFVHDGTKLRTYVEGYGQIGDGTAITGFTPSPGSPQYFGRDFGGAEASAMSLFAACTGQVVLSPAQALAYLAQCEAADALVPFAGAEHFYDLTLDTGNGTTVSATMTDRIGTDHMARVGALELAVDIVKGPAAPAQITDTATKAGGDALVVKGKPEIVTIDPSVEGRRTLGAQGFSSSSCLRTADGAGIRGASTGFHIRTVVTFGSLSGIEYFASCANASATRGWSFLRLNATLYAYAGNDTAGQSIRTLTAADLNIPHLLELTYDGAKIEMIYDGVPCGAATAGYTPVATSPMLIGNLTGLAYPAASTSVYLLEGGNFASTLAETQAAYAYWQRTGKLEQTPKSEHLYDLTADIAASGVDAVPAQVPDRIGTDHLTRVGPDVQVAGKRGLALSANGYMRGAPGTTTGIAGAPTALTVSVLWHATANILASHYLAAKWGPESGGRGWFIGRWGGAGSTGGIYVQLNGTLVAAYGLPANLIGQLIVVSITYDGTNLRTYVDGALVNTSAVASYTITDAAFTVGTRSDGNTSGDGSSFYGIDGGAYVATQAELATQATASKAAGRVVAIPGKNADRRYNFDEDAVEQATTLPLRSINRANATDDPLLRVGSGLTLAQRTERLFSYETSPICTSVEDLSVANNLQTAGGPVGSAAGLHFGMLWRPTLQSGSATRVLLEKINTGYLGGYDFFTSGLHSILQWQIFTAAGVGTVATGLTITATDIGKLMFVAGVLEPSGSGWTSKLYAKRALQGSGTAIATYAPPTQPLFVGARGTGGLQLPATNSGILGIVGGDCALTAAEYFALHDAVMHTEEIRGIEGKSNFMVNFKRDADANGGVLPAQCLDRLGAAHLTRNGSPIATPVYARAWSI